LQIGSDPEKEILRCTSVDYAIRDRLSDTLLRYQESRVAWVRSLEVPPSSASQYSVVSVDFYRSELI
jgi:hypothetical protein